MPPRLVGNVGQQPQRNSAIGEQMEPAVKHTYLCGSDEWCTERAEVSIAPNSFAQGGMRSALQVLETDHCRCLLMCAFDVRMAESATSASRGLSMAGSRTLWSRWPNSR